MPGKLLRYTIRFMKAYQIVHTGGCLAQLKWFVDIVDIKCILVKCVFS